MTSSPAMRPVSAPTGLPTVPLLWLGNFLSHSGRATRGVCEELTDELEQRGWPVIRTSNRPARLARLADMLGTAWRQRRHYRVAHVDVFSGPAFVWAEAAVWLLRRLGKPTVLTLHGGNLPRFARAHPRRFARLLRHAAAVTAPSRYLVEQLALRPVSVMPATAAVAHGSTGPDPLARGPAPWGAKPCHIIPNPIDLSLYPYRRREAVRPALVWLRAFHDIYRPAMAVRAAAEVRSEFPETRLVMFGPDKDDGSRTAAAAAVADLGMETCVTMGGAVPKPEVGAHLAAHDIFLNTSSIDNTPISVVEALACGLCVVSTRVGGIPYLLSDGEDAILVPPDDAHAMAAAVIGLLRRPALAERLSRQGRACAATFDKSCVLPQWEVLLRRIAESAAVAAAPA